jgi:hypothetical protein
MRHIVRNGDSPGTKHHAPADGNRKTHAVEVAAFDGFRSLVMAIGVVAVDLPVLD